MLNMPQAYLLPLHAGDGSSLLEHEVQSLRKQLADALAAQEQERQQTDTAQRHVDSAAALLPGSQARLDGLQVQRPSSALLYLPYPFKDLSRCHTSAPAVLLCKAINASKCWPAGWLGSMQ